MKRRRCWLPDLDEILARQLERGLDRLRAARDVVDPLDAVGGALDQMVGQRLRGLGREEAGVRIGEPFDLGFDRRDHPGMIVAEARHRGAAAGIQVAVAVAVDDLDALAAHGDRILVLRLAVEDVAHGGLTSDRRGCSRRSEA